MKETRGSGSKWEGVRRCLIMLRQLQRGSKDRKTLMQSIRELLPDAYTTGTQDAQRRAFERDLENLRDQLQAVVDWNGNVYDLVDIGPYAGFDLSDEALQGLALLFDTFSAGSGGSEVAHPFLDEILSLLPLDRQRQLKHTNSVLRLNLHRLDDAEIKPIVWQKVRQAVNRHVLRFRYSSPKKKSQQGFIIHTVEPYILRLHRGHYELKAYCRHWVNMQKQEKYEAGWFRYRLDRILAEEIEIFPERLPKDQRHRRLVRVRYRISPRLASGGVSRYFEEMTVQPSDAQGWVEVTGKTDDLFEAERTFLAYGEHCIVLEPLDLARKMKRVAYEVSKLYENLPNL